MNITATGMSNNGVQKLRTVQSTPARMSFKNDLFNNFEIPTDMVIIKTQDENKKDSTPQGWNDVREFKAEPPKISWGRVLFHRLTKEQIEEINTNKILPKNAKFENNIAGGVNLTWNLWDITEGTHKLPVGYELKQGILGFTHVVREDTKAWYLKKN